MNKTFMNTPFFKNDLSTENEPSTNKTDDRLRTEVHALAEDAFHRHLISGHGDSEYPDEYQIVYQGKPKHLSLAGAHAFLTQLMQRAT
jgi:hypothetical protein